MKAKGLIQVYTGDGKGKSTAAIGQAVRAAGQNFKVGVVTFFKNPDAFGCGECISLEKIGIERFVFARKHPHFYKGISFDEVRRECLKGVDFIEELFSDESWDMLVLDEMNVAVHGGFLQEEEVLSLLKAKPEKLELVLTGRGATEGIIDQADLVSEIHKVKHPYEKGIQGRKGIEY
jgi:cob(I)alamin adenosyltransferase